MRGSRTVLREAAGEVPAAYSPGPSIYQTHNETGARLQIILVSACHIGWNRALAHVEERPRQEFAAGMGTVLRIGPDGVAVPDDHC